MLNDDMYDRFSHFFKKNSFKKYRNPKEPSVFFSLWGYAPIRDHKSFAIIVWRGTDIVKMDKKLRTISKMKNVYHVAISSYISKDLDRYGIKHKFIPIVGVKNKIFRPDIMGDEIYAYAPPGKKYYERYGFKIVDEIRKRCKYKVNIIKSSSQYDRKDLMKIYSRCFCGLRFTKHDGLPNQVIEMGLMGRRSFYNGNIPGSIKWNGNIDEIMKDIDKEAKRIGTIDYEYARQISDFVDVKDDWLDTNFWEKK